MPVIYEPWVILFYSVAAILAGILVSLVTRPVAAEKLNTFYGLTRTPIAEGEVVTRPVRARRRLAVTAADAPDRLWPGGPCPSPTSVVGFLAGWILVGAMIGGFVWLVG